MTDAISRQLVIDMLDETKRIARQNIDGAVLKTFEIVLDSLVNITNALPTIQPKRGKWIRVGSGSLYDHYECSECGKEPKWECMGDNRWKIAFTDFCPNCGCRMDGGEQ